MQLLGIQVGTVQTHDYQGEAWTTAYKKHSVTGAVFVGKLNVAGDQQHHMNVHGGEHRAVLMYSADHYDLWERELGQRLPYGSFAENLTVSGINEDTACLGDIYQIGETVRLQVAQPRKPCEQIYKALGIESIVRRVDMTHRSGWYLRVLQEGEIEAGMPVTLLERLHPTWSVKRVYATMDNRAHEPMLARELSEIPELEPGWRSRLAKAATQQGL